MKKLNALALLTLVFLLHACNINGDGLPEFDGGACADQIPIVMVHGFLASGDTYAKQAQRFMANGYCKEKLFAFDWNTLGTQNNTARLNNYIRTILEETGAPYVFLAGHSAGSGLGYGLLRQPEPSSRVAKYVHLAGIPQSGPAGPTGDIPTLNIYSDADLIASGGDIPGAINVNLIDKDHYEVATSLETFIEMYNFFFGEDPAVIDLFDPSPMIEISGKAASFGENLSGAGARIEIYELDPATGFRLPGPPAFKFRAGAQGYWGPIEVKRETYYEFMIYTGAPGDRKVHYYREPFRYDNPLVYLRTYPPLFSLGAVFLSGLPQNDNMSTVAFFGATQAAISGRDILKVDDVLLSTPELTDPASSIIAMFLYDRGDGVTTLNADPAFAGFPFLGGTDFYFPTAEPQSIKMEFNGSVVRMRNWPSFSEGVSVAVFE